MFWGLQALNPQLGGRIDFKNQSPLDPYLLLLTIVGFLNPCERIRTHV